MLTPTEAEKRFQDRIARRLKFLQSLAHCGLGVYLAAEEGQRRKAIETMVRGTAHASELPHLSAETLKAAAASITAALEAMQHQLPHDVQYRNRIRKEW